jgi:hypothetical protein
LESRSGEARSRSAVEAEIVAEAAGHHTTINFVFL